MKFLILSLLFFVAQGYNAAKNADFVEDENEIADIIEDEQDEDDPEALEEMLTVQSSDAKPKWLGGVIKKAKNALKKVGKKIGKTTKKIIKKVKKIFRRKVCYHPYGCFSRARPFNMLWNVLPQSPSAVKTRFHLYTRQKRHGVWINPTQFCPSVLKNKKTIFIIHGWKEHYAKSVWIRWYKDLFLQRGDYNIIGVYWGKGASRNYFQAAANTRLVGAQIAYLVQQFHLLCRLKFSNVHLIGFSLGAQTAGFAGRRLREKGHPIARITGLDPAGPVFARRPSAARLDSTDAKFVDVIHTSYLYFLGIKGRSGDIDFYANGGGAQPGCVKKAAQCSHARVLYLFMNTIKPKCRYRAYKCKNYLLFRLRRCRSCKNNSCTNMGYDVNKRARGKFYFRTSSKKPYC